MGLILWQDLRYFRDVTSPHPTRQTSGGCPCGCRQHVLQKPPPAGSDDERIPVSSTGDVAPGAVAELAEISGGEGAGCEPELLSNVVDRHDQAATFWCVSSRSTCSPLLN